jgi:hypothetical protein
MSFVENLVDDIGDFFGGESEQAQQARKTSFPDTIATARMRPRQATAQSEAAPPRPASKPERQQKQAAPKPGQKPARDLGVSKFQGSGENPGLRQSTKQAQPPRRGARTQGTPPKGGSAQSKFGEDPKSGITPLRAELEGRSATDIQRTLRAIEDADPDSAVMGSDLTVAEARSVLKEELKARTR